MRAYKSILYLTLPGLFALLPVPAGRASTIWNGPSIGFYHTPDNNLQDLITADEHWTRGSSLGLYNAALESSAQAGVSPKGTVWAKGTLANTNLSYGPCPFEQSGDPGQYVNTTWVVHLTNSADDIYLQLTLTNWGGQQSSGDTTFGYTRTTPGVVLPTISITNPVSGTIFAAPAALSIGAAAAVSSGTVTNVTFFTNNVSAGSVLASPFKLTINNVGAGAYALKAVATAAGISATSTVVNVTVASPPGVSITNPAPGAVFAAPANISLGASASVAGGTVTNLQFFTNGVLLKSVITAPFTFTASNLASGSYAVTAVATAGGISATSTVVNVSVIIPTPVNAAHGTVSGGMFSFSYNANPGLSYVVQSSSNLLDWLSLATNTAAANSVPFACPATNGALFYRIGLLPNP